jgi:N-acetylmuramoyl-L-alanine amidase
MNISINDTVEKYKMNSKHFAMISSKYYLHKKPDMTMKRQLFLFLFFAVSSFTCKGQSLRIVSPPSDSTVVRTARTYFTGLAPAGSKLNLNGENIKVYSTGAFAFPLDLVPGRNAFSVQNIFNSDTLKRHLILYYNLPEPIKPTKGFAIEDIRLISEGDIWLSAGEKLTIEVKATPGKKVSFLNGIPLVEADSSDTHVAGIYRGEYLIKSQETLEGSNLTVTLYDPLSKRSVSKKSSQKITFLNPAKTIIGETYGINPSLNYGLGNDRLGGAEMGFIDTLVKLEVTGKMGNLYRVRLGDNMQAYIPEENLRLLKGVNFRPASLTESWSVKNDGKFDYVTIGLTERLPYTSTQEISPTRLIVDVYGAVSNTNWIAQKQGLQAIKNVWYQQISKDIFRVFIDLQYTQLWGYEIFYIGKSLVIKVKPKPPSLNLNKLKIGIDPGHGGTNIGAMGMTGALEKNVTLAIAQKLRTELEKNGAVIAMIRSNDTTFNNQDRVRWMKKQDPAILISVHCNAGNPMAQGNSTYYKYIPYRELSKYIYIEMLGIGLKDFGNIGSFNFMFNAPTEYPNVLVETAFLSNPEEEEKLLNEPFQQKIAEGIVRGLKNFLAAQETDTSEQQK